MNNPQAGCGNCKFYKAGYCSNSKSKWHGKDVLITFLCVWFERLYK